MVQQKTKDKQVGKRRDGEVAKRRDGKDMFGKEETGKSGDVNSNT